MTTPPVKRTPKPKRPANLPHGRWLGDLEAERPLSEFERALLRACARGTACEPENWNHERPNKGTTKNTIRAELIRFLVLGGDDENPAHEIGVTLCGAWIIGTLDLQQARIVLRLNIYRSNFTEKPCFRASIIPELGLSGCAVPSLEADRIVVKDSIFLDYGFAAKGEICLRGAQIGGNLQCTDSSFTNVSARALIADRMIVKGSVFFQNKFVALGEVRLLGAHIGGNLQCSGGSFSNEHAKSLSADGTVVNGCIFLDDNFAATGEVRLTGAQIGDSLRCCGGSFSNAGAEALTADRMIVKGGVFLDSDFTVEGEVRLLGSQVGGNLGCSGGTFSNAGGVALSADGMVVTGVFFLRAASVDGAISLTTAVVGTLADDRQCWKSGNHFLDGFCYDRIIGASDAKTRIAWLKGQRRDQVFEDFKPHPWEQLIKILRDMGHPAEAAEVAIAKQKALRRAGKIGVRHANPDFTGWRLKVDELWVAAANRTTQLWHRVYGLLAGYGHRPADILAWMLALCMLNAVFYYEGRHDGLFGPTDAIIQTQPALAACGDGGTPGRVYWTSSDCPMPPEYTTFQPFLYSLDLILPLVDLGQDSDWAPIVSNEKGETLWAGRALRWLMWFEILFGWMASLMLVAIVGRLVDKD